MAVTRCKFCNGAITFVEEYDNRRDQKQWIPYDVKCGNVSNGVKHFETCPYMLSKKQNITLTPELDQMAKHRKEVEFILGQSMRHFRWFNNGYYQLDELECLYCTALLWHQKIAMAHLQTYHPEKLTGDETICKSWSCMDQRRC